MTTSNHRVLHPQQKLMLLINLIGGTAVLASYAYCLAVNPETRGGLWGHVPLTIQPLYTISMLLAAAGYFPFTFLLVLRTEPNEARVGGRFPFAIFNLLYVLILFPSALWMPLTFSIMGQWSTALWWTTRLVLATVGLASLGLVIALSQLTPRRHPLAHALAIAGAIAFFVQTGLLDALVWPAYFP